jgi:hypothetical protein
VVIRRQDAVEVGLSSDHRVQAVELLETVDMSAIKVLIDRILNDAQWMPRPLVQIDSQLGIDVVRDVVGRV